MELKPDGRDKTKTLMTVETRAELFRAYQVSKTARFLVYVGLEDPAFMLKPLEVAVSDEGSYPLPARYILPVKNTNLISTASRLLRRAERNAATEPAESVLDRDFANSINSYFGDPNRVDLNPLQIQEDDLQITAEQSSEKTF